MKLTGFVTFRKNVKLDDASASRSVEAMMESVRDFVRQYRINLSAFGLLLATFARYVWLGEWLQRFPSIAFAGFGFVCVIASDEVAEWTGSYGWTRDQWRQYPSSFVRLGGAVALIYATFQMYLA